MPFFQNPLDAEFQGNLLLGDRQYTMTFKVKGNLPNSNQLFRAYNAQPFDLSTNNTLTLNYSFDAGQSWTVLSQNISLTATTASRTTAATALDVVTDLNANATFAALFTASVDLDRNGLNYVTIKSKRHREQFKVYVSNSSAEQALRFNKKAGVSELPGFFSRHTIANKGTYSDSLGMLVQLDPTSAQDQTIIQESGQTYQVGLTSTSATVTIANTAPFLVGDKVVVYAGGTTLSSSISSISAGVSLTLANTWGGATGIGQLIDTHADWQLLRGRSGIFEFHKYTLDAANGYRTTFALEYSAGALPGDLAKKIEYQYAAGSSNPVAVLEYPYVLTSADLVTPA